MTKWVVGLNGISQDIPRLNETGLDGGGRNNTEYDEIWMDRKAGLDEMEPDTTDWDTTGLEDMERDRMKRNGIE